MYKNCAIRLPTSYILPLIGRGALCAGRSCTERSSGRHRRENAGMSNEKRGENPLRRKSKVS